MDRLRLVLIALATLIAFYIAAPVQSQDYTVGLFLNGPGSFDGYTLFAPMIYNETYLIDNNGMLVRSWDTGGPGATVYLLEDGSVIRQNRGGARQLAWDGTPIWEFEYNTDDYQAHHDIAVLPNGNVLFIATETKTVDEAISAGRDPALLRGTQFWPEHIIEVQPTGPTSGNIVWEWHVWDHLIQDFDPASANYGVVADHPELIDINFGEPHPNPADWLHANSIDYSPELDQIVFSVRQFSEFWVIDHSTTAEEAAGHSGGKSGKGGDLLYRWGNPQAYGAGDASDQQLFVQHDAQWIDPGLPGEGNILVFNNGTDRPDGNYSSIDELVPPVDSIGNYFLPPGEAYGPEELVWTYSAPSVFFSLFVSGTVRLPNGNTLISDGPPGRIFEITPAGQIVWEYVNPVGPGGPLMQGDAVPGWDNIVFRAYRYPPDYPGLAGRDLTPKGPIETVVDSDDDGLFDHEEVKTYGTDPFTADTDLDGLSDGDEVHVYDADPLLSDTDGDGLSDGDEVLIFGTDPTLVDTDGDGISDRDEIFIRGTDPLRAELLGDVDCDYAVSSVDAALILQLTAGLVSFLFCQESGDVDGDGNTTSVDAAIILQFTAGLIPSL